MVLLEYKKGSENPFKSNPHLKNIWEEKELQERAEGSIERFNENEQENGKIFLIKLNNQIIGITGYYFTEDKNCIGLRWHGIIPTMRDRGCSTEALNLLWEYLKTNEFNVKYVQEFAPSNDVRTIEYFEKIGFKKIEINPKINDELHSEIKSFKMIKTI